MRRSRLLRGSAVGVPAAALGAGIVLWLLGMTPLPAAPAQVTEALGLLRRGSAMVRGAPIHFHVPPVAGWVRARLRRR